MERKHSILFRLRDIPGNFDFIDTTGTLAPENDPQAIHNKLWRSLNIVMDRVSIDIGQMAHMLCLRHVQLQRAIIGPLQFSLPST